MLGIVSQISIYSNFDVSHRKLRYIASNLRYISCWTIRYIAASACFALDSLSHPRVLCGDTEHRTSKSCPILKYFTEYHVPGIEIVSIAKIVQNKSYPVIECRNGIVSNIVSSAFCFLKSMSYRTRFWKSYRVPGFEIVSITDELSSIRYRR